MVPLNRLPKGNVLDEWYPLLPSSHAKVEVGSIRVRSKFTVRITNKFCLKCSYLAKKELMPMRLCFLEDTCQ